MYVVAIHHAVQDFEKWKLIYDTHPPTVGWGGAFARVHRGVDDPNLVTVLAGFDSLDALKAMAFSPGLKNGMQKAGVLGEPRIEIYEEVEVIHQAPEEEPGSRQ